MNLMYSGSMAKLVQKLEVTKVTRIYYDVIIA
jgi:hypothetical protein